MNGTPEKTSATGEEVPAPSTPRAQSHLGLFEASQPTLAADLCATPRAGSSSTVGCSPARNTSDSAAVTAPPMQSPSRCAVKPPRSPLPSSASSSSSTSSLVGQGSNLQQTGMSAAASPPKVPQDSTKEAWKKRKQVLLAEARSQVPANLQLHGLRPPPPHSDSYAGVDVPILSHPVNGAQHHAPGVSRAIDGIDAESAESSNLAGASLSNEMNSMLLSASHAPHHSAILQWRDPQIRHDMFRLIDQYLEEEGMEATRHKLSEEWTGKVRQRDDAAEDALRLKEAILSGEWYTVDELLAKPLVRNVNAFRYAVFKQQFLEHIEQREFQKAFTFLNERLRDLEHYQPYRGEFRDLCYLLSCKSISDAPSFRAWEGIQPAREALVAQFGGLLEQERSEVQDHTPYVPPHRLKSLVHQAVAYQVEFSRYHPKKAPHVSSLLHDYESFVCPNTIMSTFRGHRKNVKALAWIGLEGRSLASGSSDGSVRIWRTSTAEQEAVMEHGSRVWDVASTESGNMIASAGGNGLVRLWDTTSKANIAILGYGNAGMASTGITGDIYSCSFDGSGKQLLTGGYDKIVRLYDIGSNSLLKTFTGHGLGVSSVTFDAPSRLAVTASKDCSVRLWDLNSGLCVRTVYGHLGEVTSVELSESGREMLTASKDNSSMIHDMRTLKPQQRLKGAQNTRANFVRASFAHNSLISSGSEDGTVFLWDQESSECLQTLEGHGGGTVYCARWNKAQSLLASCGDDGSLRTWCWDEGRQDNEDGAASKDVLQRVRQDGGIGV